MHNDWASIPSKNPIGVALERFWPVLARWRAWRERAQVFVAPTGWDRGSCMTKNPILALPLNQVMRAEIALPLQQMLQLYTVGNFLSAWRNPKTQKFIEQVFESPEQARHAAATCAAWLGVASRPTTTIPSAWWLNDNDMLGAATGAPGA